MTGVALELAVPIGVGIGCGAVALVPEIAVGVVGISISYIIQFFRQKLALIVVGIFGKRLVVFSMSWHVPYGCYIAQGVIVIEELVYYRAGGILVDQAAHHQGRAVGACACQIVKLAFDEGTAVHRQHTGAEPFQVVIVVGKAAARAGQGDKTSVFVCSVVRFIVPICIAPGAAQRTVPGGAELVVIARQPVGRVIGGVVGLDRSGAGLLRHGVQTVQGVKGRSVYLWWADSERHNCRSHLCFKKQGQISMSIPIHQS